MRSRRFDDAFRKLAAAEDRFLGSEFLVPVLQRSQVRVRIAGVVCTLSVTPADFQGWGVFRPRSHSSAELFRPAKLAERRHYLELFPLVRLVLCRRDGGDWLALPAHQGDRRIRIAGLVPLRLVEEAQQFDVVRTRFDGANFWFEGPDPACDPATAAWLRRSLNEAVDPNQLTRPGLTPEEKAAYAVNYYLKEEIRRQRETEQTEGKLREALHHAGAELVDYLERQDSYRVTYSIGGRQHVSAVRKDDLSVQVAGICLSGQDSRFDLASLVGVIREAEGTGDFVPVGYENRGMGDEAYWHVHPPPGA
jgi:hypothetical protein